MDVFDDNTMKYYITNKETWRGVSIVKMKNSSVTNKAI